MAEKNVMAEGELEKRITDNLNPAWNAKTFDESKHKIIDGYHEIRNVLNEARNGFPLQRLEQAQADNGSLESVENSILIWFKKWHGEQK